MVMSAVSSVKTFGVLVTVMPRACAAVTSILSTPLPKLAIMRSLQSGCLRIASPTMSVTVGTSTSALQTASAICARANRSRRRSAAPTCWCRSSPTWWAKRSSDCKLRMIADFGNGVDNIDRAAQRARHHRDQHAEGFDRRHRRHDHGADPRRAAADRGRVHPDRGARAGRAGRRPGCSAIAVGGKRLAVVGMGRIGQAVARRARASACRSTITTAVRSSPTSPRNSAPPLGKPPTRCWRVSVNCPHTPATYHLLSARRLN